MHELLLVIVPPFPCPFIACKGLFIAATSSWFIFSNQRTCTKRGMDNTNYNGSTVIYAVHLSWHGRLHEPYKDTL